MCCKVTKLSQIDREDKNQIKLWKWRKMENADNIQNIQIKHDSTWSA